MTASRSHKYFPLDFKGTRLVLRRTNFPCQTIVPSQYWVPQGMGRRRYFSHRRRLWLYRQVQEAVARAAKEAGVQVFVPAEHAYATHTIQRDTSFFIVGKRLFLDLIRDDLKLPWQVGKGQSFVHNQGQFPTPEPEPSDLPPCNPSSQTGVAPFEATRYHLASYLVHLVLDVPCAETAWGIYRLLGLKKERLISESK
ncbi:hypothetical protein GLOTRDRAFT_96488 [Gloeophyllum trabeum ATCC 11539]|uniref:Uncharacterized protein n=1 Tax=Gloeophyllum trabeum (strain ATCC 11539 / FP-39264 / Madison 617) TaxID=670483 RepID=S7RFM8_GLOTA|nr:uncharacterized protein GLOTRDRAFT_96488 [Gloeophyllum trabeum ATCC 11539]EPQ51319.1 hypothetical protein GLOTRDRAFT_96488 [Gloeophyllum trabeum ATCC 11539]